MADSVRDHKKEKYEDGDSMVVSSADDIRGPRDHTNMGILPSG